MNIIVGLSKGTLNGTTGQLTHIIDNLDRNKDRVYEFDTLGRLNKAKGGAAAGASATANWTQDYSYDRYGNKLTTANAGYTANYQAIPLDGLPSQSFDVTSNRITTAGTEYDKAGNLIRGKAPDGSWQRFEYDSAGRLVKIKTDANVVIEEYTYGANRQRLRKEANSQRTYYAWGGSSVLMEYFETTTALTWAKSYIYAGSRLLSTITNTAGTEVTEYHHPDRLGTRLITNPVGATQVEQNTLPFGTSIDAETTGTSNQRFTSYDRSDSTGLDYAMNRTYNSGQSRFTQVDPIGMASASIGNPQSLNLFAYVQNNPIDFVDPSGLDGDDLGCGGVGEPGCVVTVTDDYNPFDSDWWRSFARHSAEHSRGGGRGGGSGGSAGPSVGSRNDGPTYGNQGAFTSSQKTAIENALKKIMSKKCKDFLNLIIKNIINNPWTRAFISYGNADELISGVELNQFKSSMSAADMGITQEERDIIADEDGTLSGPGGFGVAGTNRIWLNATPGLFSFSAFGLRKDLAGIIVHEMLHKLLGDDEKRVRSYNDLIQENCGDSKKDL